MSIIFNQYRIQFSKANNFSNSYQLNSSQREIGIGVIFLFLFCFILTPNVFSAVIQIDSIEELQKIGNDAAYPLNGEYELTQNISANDTVNWNAGAGFKPIGTSSAPFIGKFNGNGHKITGLYINRSEEDYVGLFGYIGSVAEIKNLGVEDCWIIGGSYIGGLVGDNWGSITSSYSTGAVSGFDYVGGLVGYNGSYGSITSSYGMGTVSGGFNVGGLVGESYYGSILSSYSTGAVSGVVNIGGLVGWNYGGSITSSYSTGVVSGVSSVGGLVGYNYKECSIVSSYSTGAVSGYRHVGGLVGITDGVITSSYSTGAVSGSGGSYYVGGLVGRNYGVITSSYSTGVVSGTTLVGGLVGWNYGGSITSSYWDKETSGQSSSSGGEGKTTVEMMQQATYIGWDFTTVWMIEEGVSYPYLIELGPTQVYTPPVVVTKEIRSLEELSKIGKFPDYPWWWNYELMVDIDASATLNWNEGKGFEPLRLFGKFDGNGHVIRNLYINRSNEGYIGFFGILGSGGEVRELGVDDCWIVGGGGVGVLVGVNGGIITSSYSTGAMSGGWNVGGLVGVNYGSITSSYSTGAVWGTGDNVGGLVGYNEGGSITSSYSTGEVSGGDNIGGLVGWNYGGIITSSYSTGEVSGSNGVGGLVGGNEYYDNYYGSIASSYSTGAVSGYNYVGGLVGRNYGSITSSYWDKETSGQSSSAGGEGKTTAEMKQQATYIGWDFTTVWKIVENVTYPYLQGFSPTATITILGNAELNLECNMEYVDAGATANDAIEGDLTSEIQVVNNVNSSVVGNYTVVYSVMDSGGRTITATRTVHVIDTTPPVITLIGPNPFYVECHSVYNDPGATATDSCDASVAVATSGAVDTNVVGEYMITYSATDASGNASDPVVRTVQVVDTQTPEITLLGSNPMVVECKSTFEDPGATATDSCDSSVEVEVTGAVDIDVIGEYTITYAATDSSNNSADSLIRTVQVVDTQKPVITLLGDNPIILECKSTFEDPGATATDSCDSSVEVEVTGGVDIDVIGEYTITYAATDSSNNSADSVTRTVQVVDTQKPEITLLGNNPIVIECKSTFEDPGATATDSCDSSVEVEVTGGVDIDVIGEYTITYAATDSSNNSADSLTRTVQVVDTTPPEITLLGDNLLVIPLNSSFTDPGATVVDNCDDFVEVIATGEVNTGVADNYTIIYTATDASGNAATPVTRTVVVGEVVEGTPEGIPEGVVEGAMEGLPEGFVEGATEGIYEGSVEGLIEGEGSVEVWKVVPNVKGMNRSSAESAIVAVGLTVGSVTQQCSNTVSSGKVISQNPTAGTQVVPSTVVNLVVSSGPCTTNVIVPNVVGRTESQAQGAIEAAGLIFVSAYECSDSIDTGTVIRQNPAGDAGVSSGSSVTVWISTGPCSEVTSDTRLRAYAGVDHNYIEWDAWIGRDLLGYRLYRGESEEQQNKIVAGANEFYNDTSYRDFVIDKGKTYWYKLEIHKSDSTFESIGPVKVEGGRILLWISDIDWKSSSGKEIRVPVNIGNATGLVPDSMDIDISYNADILEVEKVEKTAVTAYMQVYYNTNENGVVQTVFVPANLNEGGLVGEGHLFDIVFKTKGEVLEDTCVQLNFVENAVFDSESRAIPVEVRGGELCIRSQCMRGDVNGDGNVYATDARRLLQQIVNKSWDTDYACELRRGDMNGDGVLDVADVTMILRWSVGLDINPPQEGVTYEKLLAKMIDKDTDVVIISKSPSGSELSNFGVPVEFSSIGGLSGMEIAITYGNGLSYKGVDLDTKVTGFNKEEFLGEGYVRVSIGGKEAVVEDVRSQVMVFKFDVAAASGELKEERSIQIREVRLKGQYGDDFRWYGDVKRQDGVITVCPAIKDMRGMTWDEVTDWLIAAGYKPDKREEGDLNVAVGMVIGTEPGSSQILSAGNKVVVIVNKGATAEQLKEEIKNKFGTLDENGDDLLSWEEISSKYPGVSQDTFNSLDSDADGKLSKTESGVIEQEGEGTHEGEGGGEDGGGCGCSGDKDMPSFDGFMKYLLDILLVGFLISLMSAMKKQSKR